MGARDCLFLGCPDPVNAKGMCGRHYRRVERGVEAAPAGYQPEPRPVSTRWQVDAACRYVDPELFFPVSERPTDPSVVAARRVCESCPVLDVCREWALTNMGAGVAGGLTTDERREIRDARKSEAAQLENAGGAR
jgi:WhiB family redox-sensing transcriptional regulator